MKTIQAKVNPRLLTKANRLFTGSLSGRIIEILQNARRAGATEVSITNENGYVTIRDNGSGIEDFSMLLDLGNSNWDDSMEKAEDPAGVGIFCLSPRELTVLSNNRKVHITEDVWTGTPVEVSKDDGLTNGTTLTFQDESWELSEVQKHAVFSGMKVIVDGEECPQETFCSEKAVSYLDLGCRIEICQADNLSKWHRLWRDYCHGYNDVLVNFHGQVLSFHCNLVSDDKIRFLVDMTGEPTDIRLMLPARTRLVEDKALESLKAAIEVEAYRFIAKRGKHKLPFKEYLRARELGIELPEAEPIFNIGLLAGDTPEPMEVIMPQEVSLSQCYRLNPEAIKGDEYPETNVHLLAALGEFKSPFVPVNISSSYDGYSWAKLATIDKVEVAIGKELGSNWVWNARLVAVKSLQISVHTSDGKVFKSDVPMAVLPQQKEGGAAPFGCDNVYVTLEAQELSSPDIWYHLGGWNDEGDTYDTQEYQLQEQLDYFWSTIIGPGEYLRTRILTSIGGIVVDWRRITIEADGTVVVQYKDGKEDTFKGQ